MPEFVDVAYKDALKPGECKVVLAGNREIALYNIEGKFYATDNTGLHKGGPLGDGELAGNIVVCPWHGWEFDVTTGENKGDAEMKVACFEVQLKDEQVQIRI